MLGSRRSCSSAHSLNAINPFVASGFSFGVEALVSALLGSDKAATLGFGIDFVVSAVSGLLFCSVSNVVAVVVFVGIVVA